MSIQSFFRMSACPPPSTAPPRTPGPRRPVVILGPTAGGKSDLAAALAAQCNGPVLGADSMQVYRHLDAGTAKPPPTLRDRVPHYLIDIVEPTERFTVHDWLRRADRLIEQTLADGQTPVIVGGTNLYLKALLEGLFDGPGQDAAFRETLAGLPGDELHARLQQIDPPAAARIAPADRQRLTRALEVFHLTGRPISTLQKEWANTPPAAYRHAPVLLGLRWAVDDLNPRINLRVKAMFYPERVAPELARDVCIHGESLPDEVRRLVETGRLVPGTQAAEALGYKQVLAATYPRAFPEAADPLIQNLGDAFERTKILTRRFAKQQRTWLKRFRGVHWIDLPTTEKQAPLATALANLHAPDR
ncbi:MAG: tRNA (adenosine(37)-N6)-dimethylallyltransferase MiaA [Planctomycetota bacterium]